MIIIAPPQVYEVNGEVCKVQCSKTQLTVANNQTVIPMVTGKIIRVIGMLAHSSGAGTFNLKDGATGGLLLAGIGVVAGVPFVLPMWDAGYLETTVSTALGSDCGTAAVNLNVFYITYKP